MKASKFRTSRAGRSARAVTAQPGRRRARQRIFDAALQLFAARGFASTTTAAIALKAGVAEKTLFSHFGTKDALFDEVLALAARQALLGPCAPDGDPLFDAPWVRLEDFLHALLDSRITLIERNASKFKLVLQELLLRPERAAPLREAFDLEIAPRIDAVLGRLRERGELRDVPAPVVRGMATSLMLGYSIRRVVFPRMPSRERCVEIHALAAILAHGLAPPSNRRQIGRARR